MPMNSIDIRTGAERHRASAKPLDPAHVLRQAAVVVSIMLLTIMLISFQPFAPVHEGAQEGGNLVNQLGFGLLGLVALCSLLMLADLRKLPSLVGPAWMLMVGFLLFSGLTSPDPSATFRGIILTLIVMMTVVTVLALPQDGDGYARLLSVVSGILIFICYAGIPIVPSLATHGFDALEPQNSYLWRGVFTHKNIAGPVMAAFAFAAIYLWRRGDRRSGILIGLAALIFISQTGSKTTLGLVPVAALLVLLPSALGLRILTPIAVFCCQLAFALLTFGSVLIEPIHQFVLWLGIDPTFTGRVSIWKFGLDALADRPWTGFGYESFWSTDLVLHAANPYYLDWDVRGIVHAHNGYLDIAISMGIPALILALAVLIVFPLVDYMRCRPIRENLLLADFFMMIVFFTTLNAMMESFFFRRMDPVWMLCFFGVIGLRLVARVGIPRKAA